MDALRNCCSAISSVLWSDRASVKYCQQNEIRFFRQNHLQIFKEGLAIGVGPSGERDREHLYFDYAEQNQRLYEGCAFREEMENGGLQDRCEICEESALMFIAVPCDLTQDICASSIDLCACGYFCLTSKKPDLSKKKGVHFCGSMCGNCLKVPLDVVFYLLRAPYLASRFCCFERMDCIKQRCLPFPLVENYFFHKDCQRIVQEGKTWSEEAYMEILESNKDVVVDQPQAIASAGQERGEREPESIVIAQEVAAAEETEEASAPAVAVNDQVIGNQPVSILIQGVEDEVRKTSDV